MDQSTPEFLDELPLSPELTDYDRDHVVLYLRILDAAREGADWREVVQVLFDLDAARDPARCQKVYDAHLARAQWMSDSGYRGLLRSASPSLPVIP